MSNSPKEVAQDQLRSFVERIERLEEEKKQTSDDIKDVYAEAKGNGFDVKVLRKVLALRKQDANERAEFDAILDLYLGALGMLPQPRLPFEDENPRTKKPERERTTVQILDGEGNPLTPPMDSEDFTRAAEKVARKDRRRASA